MAIAANDGRVVVHNAIALDEPAWPSSTGGVAVVIFVPNGFHRQDALIWKQRFPKARS